MNGSREGTWSLRVKRLPQRYVQRRCFGPALEVLDNGSADDFEICIKRLRNLTVNSEKTRQVNELKTMRNLRPCLESDSILRVEGRLENTDLPTDTKHPIILPSRHALTRLVVLYKHSDAGHAGPSYTHEYSATVLDNPWNF